MTENQIDEIGKQIQQDPLLQRLMSGERAPFANELHQLITGFERSFDLVNRIGDTWKSEYLDPAVFDPNDMDGYAKPIITLAEIIRRQRSMLSFAQLIYEKAIELTNKHCDDNNVDLHRGALFANLAIIFLEQGRFKKALPWLHAAAEQDIAHRPMKVSDIYGSYAFSKKGIFSQWLESAVIPKLPPEVVSFVNANLGTALTTDDVKAFIVWLAGRGDLHIISSLLDFDEVYGQHDFHANSVRLSAIRDLSSLFEVVLKQIGRNHNDVAVQAMFSNPPTLAALICHMHFVEKKNKRRANPALNANRKEGLFHNSLLPNGDLLDAIDSEIDFCAGTSNTVDDVWNHLQGTTISANSMADESGKRILMAYKLRNTTAHSFDPSDANMIAHFDDFRLWLLQAVFFIYFWAKNEGYAAV